jgi:hypothetical protein
MNYSPNIRAGTKLTVLRCRFNDRFADGIGVKVLLPNFSKPTWLAAVWFEEWLKCPRKGWAYKRNGARYDIYGEKHQDGGEYAPIATVHDEVTARFIVAAPKLLSLLEEVLVDYRGCGMDQREICGHIRKAIAEVKGQQ